ncbi:hypothetical protein [Trichothermofontia sp.]
MKMTKTTVGQVVGLMGGLGVCFSLSGLPPAIAQTQAASTDPNSSCQYLREISTGQTHIRKRINTPTVGIVRSNNWNTDFAVPAGTPFSFYVAVMTPENNAQYDATINMIYPDRSSSTAFERRVPLERGRTYSLPFQSPTGRQPHQINFRIGGANNNAYTISALACQ